MKLSALLLGGTVLFSASIAKGAAGPNDGGGGGAYMCPQPSGGEPVALLADLWEAENTPFRWPNATGKIAITRTNEKSAEAQFAQALARLASVDPAFAAQVGAERQAIFSHVNYLPPNISIALPDDLKLGYFPTGCNPVGVMYFNGESGQLDIKREYFDRLETQTDIAAAWMHEAVYKVLREQAGAVDSKGTRRLVACTFSNENCLAYAEVLPKDRFVVKCASKSYSLFIYPEEKLASPALLWDFQKHKLRGAYQKIGNLDFRYVPIANISAHLFSGENMINGEGTKTVDGMAAFGMAPRVDAFNWQTDHHGEIIGLEIFGYRHFYNADPSDPDFVNQKERLACLRLR